MAQSYVTEAGTLIIPQAVSSIKVETANSGLGTTGVLMIVGEADAGPRFSEEDSLQDNSFGPDQLGAVIAKYQSGPIVDAMFIAAAPSNDPNIVGAPSRIIIVKTNASTKATSALTVHGSGAYVSADALALSLADKSYGKLGNLIYYTIDTETAEVIPTTGSFTFIPAVGTVNATLRPNGGAGQALSLGANASPAAFVTAVDAMTSISATGGAARTTIQSATGTIALAIVSGNSVTVTYSVAFTTTPSVGDTLVIPATSVLSVDNDGGGADVATQGNTGAYVITAATSTTITATKLSDAGASGAVPGTITAPTTKTAKSVSATVANDLIVYGPVTVTLEAANPVLGAGKVLEINQLATGTDLLNRTAKVLGTTTNVSWISATGAAVQIVSGAEYRVQLNVNRQRDNIQEELIAGGEIALKIGYTGTTATLTIDDDELTLAVVGGSGAGFTMDLTDFPTISDVATFINSKTGFTCSVGTAILGQLPSSALDNVTALAICTTFGEQPGRVKIDGYRFGKKVTEESVLVQIQDSAADVVSPCLGLPQPVSAVTYLAGAVKGATTDADVVAAMLALERVRGNFVIPLFSRDASEDIEDRLTEVGSTYTIAGINASTRSHVLKCSTLKRKRNRQAFISMKDTFMAVKTAAANTASFRCAFPFQDQRNPDSTGSVKQMQPWANAVNAAAMQAAAFYKAIVRKYANIVGALQAAEDFDDQDDTQVEDALLAGLLPLRRSETGGWYWVSDQTTYGKDSNFVFNSIQATYVADVIALSTAQRMETAFVGQSVADVSAALAMAFLETIMGDFLRLKLIAASDDAPKGFKNATIRISGTAMVVSLEVKLAGAIYFIPISFLVSQVVQSA